MFENFFSNLGKAFGTTNWWQEIAVFLVFSVMLALVNQFVLWFLRTPYRGWRLRVEGVEDEDQALDWEEVRRLLNSDFELWKLAKSAVSGSGHATLSTPGPAKDAGWLHIERGRLGGFLPFPSPGEKLIVVDTTHPRFRDHVLENRRPSGDPALTQGGGTE